VNVTWRLGVARAGLEITQFFRDRESAVFNFLLPVLLLIIFGAVFGGAELGGTGITFAQYFAAGMIASGIVYASFQNLAIAIPLEREDGTLKRLQGTPMPRSSYFIGKVLMVVVIYVAQVSLLIIVGSLFYGIDPPASAAKWLTFLWVSLLGLTSCTLLGIAFSAVSRSGRGASALVTPVVLVLQFTSGVFFFFADLPGWMQDFASVFPLRWLTQAMRYVFLPESADVLEVGQSWQLGTSALVLAAWTIAGFLLATRFFRWSARGE